MVFGKTKKTHSAILISLFLLFSVFFTVSLTSCDNAVSSSQNEEADNTKTPAGPDKGYLRFRVTVPDGNARTALPQIDVNNIQDISITGILNGNSQNLGTWADITGMQNASISVQPGEWQLTLFARYNGFSFSSTQTVSVSVGSVSNVSFALSSNTMNGGCTIQVNFASTREAHHASYQITNLATSASAGSGNLTIQNGTSNKYVVLERNSSSPLSDGNYTVIITFYGDLAESIILNTFRETMHVQGGFVSTITRTIDLNEIFTIEYHNTEDASVASGSLVENYSINSNYSTITFPDLSKTNNVFRGWYSSPTFDSTSRVTRLPDNATGTQHFYAKWEPFHPLEYKIINYSNEATSTLTAAQMTSYNLPDMHDPSGPTDLSVNTMTDGESHNISCDFYYDYDSTSGCSNQITGNAIALDAIPEDRTSATTIYIKPNITHVYLDPSSTGTGSDTNWPFNVSTPAKSVAAARKWVGTGDSYTLYVKDQISSKTDIEKLSNGPLVKRYKTVTKNLIQITSVSLNLENVIIDGGADWGTVDANASVYNLTKNGINSTGAIIGIVATTKNVTVNMTNVTIQNNDNTYSSQGGLLINTSSSYTATLNLTDCIIQNCRCQGDGGGIRVLGKSNVTITGGTFAHNAALGGGVSSDAGDGGAIAIMTENGASSVTANGTTFTANKAKDSGGAIFINGSSALSTISGCPFSYNTLNDSTGLGKTICVLTNSTGTSNLKLSGTSTLTNGDGQIYTDTLAPIMVDSTTAVESSVNKFTILLDEFYTAGTPPVFNKKVLDFTGLTSDQITSVKAAFQPGGTNASNYEIDYEGVIKPKAGSLIVVPGFPNLYKCGYTMTASGSTRTIAISIKDTFNNAVSTSQISNLKVTIFDHGDVVKTITGNSVYSFTYPVYLDDPNDHTFYVEFKLKSDENSSVAYYYDFYAASGI